MYLKDIGLWMIWRDFVKRNGLRFLSLYSTILLDVMGEDLMLFYWQREIVQSIKCHNCGTHGFVKNNYLYFNLKTMFKKIIIYITNKKYIIQDFVSIC